MNQGKTMHDPLHGYMEFTPLVVTIIDTPEFQRLHDLTQLGASYKVFPSATHTRFEHSLGVAYLAKKMFQHLQTSQPELNITNWLIELAQIAGLLHDIGHSAFSHVFDNEIASDAIFENDPIFSQHHETRSCNILQSMVIKYKLPLSDADTQLIQDMMSPKPEQTSWLYQIIANPVNHIDVDKIDYLARDNLHLGLKQDGDFSRLITKTRVIDNQLCYLDKLRYDIVNLFSTRFWMHKRVYNHTVSKAYEYLISDLVRETLIEHPEMNFMELTESVVLSKVGRSKIAKTILNKIDFRQHPTLLVEHIWENDESEDERTNKIKQMLDNFEHIQKDQLITQHYRIGFVSGVTPNPLENVWYFSKDKNTKFRIPIESISSLIAKPFQEHGVRIFKKV